MEIFIQDMDPAVERNELKVAIAKVLHGGDFQQYQPLPINFEVSVFPPKAGQCRRGALTLPTHDIGQHFLRDYGGKAPAQAILAREKAVRFKESRNSPRPKLVEKLNLVPYVDPEQQEEKENLWEDLQARTVSVSAVQFGWECRDNVYSVEYEKRCQGCGTVSFDAKRREFRVRMLERDESIIVVIRAAQIAWAALEPPSSGQTQTTLFLSLQYSPAYESDLDPVADVDDDTTAGKTWTTSRAPLRRRRAALNFEHQFYAMYTSLAIQIVCNEPNAFDNLKSLCQHAHIKRHKFVYPIDRGRLLFSPEVQDEYQRWLASLEWEIAFQVDALARNNMMDLREILCLKSQLARLSKDKSLAYVARFVRYLGREARDPAWYRGASKPLEALKELFIRCRKDFVPPEETSADDIASGSLQQFDCLHAIVTPTTVHLEGPFPERCNRVIRKYAKHTASFIRVCFADEAGLQFRPDRDVDYRAFIRERFGCVLQRGLVVAGRHFQFLGYSQSGLREHSVWFAKDFTQEVIAADNTCSEETMTVDTIIAGLGIFHNLPQDPHLIECPARYGARIAQSFSATEASTTIDVGDVRVIPDIMDAGGERAFTDGIGTISPEVAKDIWTALCKGNKRRVDQDVPPAFQTRIQGAKGMHSVDHNLSGRVVCLRPSMIKFDAPELRVLEIAAVFHKPGKFYLNRPLIMLLEELDMAGGYEFLESLQEDVKKKTKAASQSLENAAQFFENSRLGQTYALSKIFQELSALGVGNLADQIRFHLQVVNFGKHHVLRDLKYRARIPIPGGWNVVGVADIHGFLEEGQIFVCIMPGEGKDRIYLQGATMVARSPVVHRGDVQVVTAIGPPPPGSPFEIEPLKNTVVFSTKGSRPLPSCLGGGDLDGDEYVVTDMAALLPRTTYDPASYDKATRKTIGRPSTRSDVAEFVTEYLYSDTIGTIATNWLTIADQSPKGVLAPDSEHGNAKALERLAELHSDAVDYPKSGTSVAMRDIPRSRLEEKPDWSAPEIPYGDGCLYYTSRRWIGQLYREIQLSDPEVTRPPINPSTPLGFLPKEKVLKIFQKNDFPEDAIETAVRARVAPFVQSVYRYSTKRIEHIWRSFKTYVSALRTICVTFSLVQRHGAMLTEEEVVVGTIVAQSTQPRARQDKMAQMRDQASLLVARILRDIVGSNGDDKKEIVKRAWVAFRVSTMRPDEFGSRSFGLIALRELFDAIKSLEENAAESGESTTPVDSEHSDE